MLEVVVITPKKSGFFLKGFFRRIPFAQRAFHNAKESISRWNYSERSEESEESEDVTLCKNSEPWNFQGSNTMPAGTLFKNSGGYLSIPNRYLGIPLFAKIVP